MRRDLLATAPLLGGMLAMTLTLPCEQRLSDARMYVDGSLLPPASVRSYTIENYAPTRHDAERSYGQCVVRFQAETAP